MNHRDHVTLLRKGIVQGGGVWADLGSGDGAFTLALADLLGEGATIYAVDREASVLRHLAQAMQTQFPQTTLHTIAANFERPVALPPLDGIVMANSLHFVRNQAATLAHVRSYLKSTGRLLMVEYNSDQGNMWVPHAFSYPTWERMSQAAGFRHTELLATYPSRFLREIYSAASW